MATQPISESWPCIDVIDYQESDGLFNEMQALEILGATLFEDSQDCYCHDNEIRLRSLIQSLEAEINNHSIPCPCATTAMELDQLQVLLMDHQASDCELCASTPAGSMYGQDWWSTPIDDDLHQFEWVDSEHVAASSPQDDMNWWVEPVLWE
ncbi:hypothetical protein FNV43_RR16207 [Rhamnella rubrinervis]|uniref:Uncharacterized protein n=1 Tax=Rhamnella rubrinervis TaxID=2594499 RepID=A0A8K0E8X5_9ROSA|nr:hypothetical protein FNV43_RR16207 [Rhamnella rubrinervis]